MPGPANIDSPEVLLELKRGLIALMEGTSRCITNGVSDIARVQHWLQQERGTLSVLIHPHSTDGAWADHTRHAVWLGTPLQLRLRRQQTAKPAGSVSRSGPARMLAPDWERRPADAALWAMAHQSFSRTSHQDENC